MSGVAPEAVAGALEAQARLEAHLDTLDDASVRRPSRLPDWSVGHVLTHLARNADSMVRLLQAAERDEHVLQYAGGNEQRAAEIDAGSARSAAELVADVRASAALLADAYAAAGAATWARTYLRWGDQPWPVADQPFLRWREIELHAVDLGLPGVDESFWSDRYVDVELRRQVGALAPRLPARTGVVLAPSDPARSTILLRPGDGDAQAWVTVDAPPRSLLAWLTGRAPGEPTWPSLAPWQGAP